MIFNAYADAKAPTLGILPLSCGHIFAQKGRKVSRPVGREDYLLFWVVKGEEAVTLKKGQATMTPGSFLLYAPGEPQIHETVSDSGEFYFMHFSTDGETLRSLSLETARVYDAPPAPELIPLFEAILGELQLRRAYYEQVSVSLLWQILAHLGRSQREGSAAPAAYFDRISYAASLINRTYGEDKSLEDYAAMVSMSKYHFARTFQRVTGQTPMAYRNQLRIEHAKEMLLDTAKTVGEIAEAVGIPSPSYFHRAFLAHTGQSPTEYRKRRVGRS